MSLITPATPVIQTRAEVAVGADLTAPSESWDWIVLGDYTDAGRTRPRVLDQTVKITSGITGDTDESLVGDPTAVDLLLGNGDQAFTPYNPSSIYYPGLRRKTPLRVSVQAGLPHLVFRGVSGSRASTPDDPALDITGDLAGVIELLSPVQMPPSGVTYDLAGKSTSGNISWILHLLNGSLILLWSTDGTTFDYKIQPLGLPCPEAGPLSIGWEFDVSNGGENICTFYVHRGDRDGLLGDLDGSLFADPIIDPGVTSFFSGSAPLQVGDVTFGFSPYPGRLNRLQLRSGDLTSGTVVADLDCTTLTPGATGTTDSAGRVWSFADAQVTDWRPRACVRVTKAEPTWDLVDEGNPLMPTVAHVQVAAEGTLQRLAQSDPVRSTLTRIVTAPTNADLVVACWPFEDNRDATRVGQVIAGAAPMSIQGDYTFGGDTSYAAVSQQMTVAAGDNALMTAPIPEIPQVVGVNWQITKLFRIDEPAVSPAVTGLMAVSSNGEVATWALSINDTQITIAGFDIDGTGVVLDTIAADARFFDTEAMIVLEVTDDGANVDWAVSLIPIPLGLVFATSGTYAGNTGIPTRFKNSCTGPPSGISLGPVIVSTGAPIGWLAPADTAYVGEPAPQRVFRLCQENHVPVAVHGPYGPGNTTSWPAAVREGAVPMGPQRPAKLLELLTECVDADLGILTEQRGALGLAYRSGATLKQQPVRLSLPRAGRLVDDPFQPADDDQRFVNDVTVERTDGSSYRIEDPDIATGDEERYSRSVEVNVKSDLLLPGQAGWRYHLGVWQEMRYPEIRTDVSRPAAPVEDILGFAAGDRFRIPDPPPGHAPEPVDQLAYGITEDLTKFKWKASFNGRPARPWDTSVVDDGEFGRVDTAGAELASQFVAGADTSMSVATTLGTLWTVESDDFPFDIEAAGVRLTVTNITGASSPQTFTITQTPVNGVTKTIPAGTRVRLWQGAVVAL